jgi:hypothetical protein
MPIDSSSIKKPILGASIALGLTMAPVFATQVVNCVTKKNAVWSEAGHWQNGSVPSEENEMAIMNGGLSATIDSPFEAPIRVKVGNGRSPAPDGTLIINANFRVKVLGVATADGTSGRVEQSSAIFSLEELSLSALSQETLGATYDLIGGKLETEVLRLGITGPANLNLEGNAEVAAVHMRLQAGSQSAIRLAGTRAGFPSLNAANAHITIEPGATFTMDGAGAATKPGKYTLIQAKEPLAGKWDVNLTNFVAGKAIVLKSEPGIVLKAL